MLKAYLKNVVLVGAGIVVGTGLILAANASPTEFTYYQDIDNDGYGSSVATTTLSDIAPSGYVATSSDCNDAASAIHPGAAELCDGIDNDCDGSIDEGVKNTYYYDQDADNFGTSFTFTLACTVPANYVATSSDCNDLNNLINPLASEVYDAVDNNCNGLVDEGILLQTYYRDADGDSYGNPSISTTSPVSVSGYVSNNTDCDDANANINPGVAETFDNIDNNCNGQTDEGITVYKYYRDADSDTYGDPNSSTSSPVAISGYVLNNTDCNDSNAAIHPNATELDDDIDNDCDGSIDEGFDDDSMPGDYSSYPNHGAYVSQWAHHTNKLKAEGEISGKEKGLMMREAAHVKKESKTNKNNGKGNK